MQSLQKMCQDLSTVMRRYITDVQKEKEQVAPIKITRSVGLQARMLFKAVAYFSLNGTARFKIKQLFGWSKF